MTKLEDFVTRGQAAQQAVDELTRCPICNKPCPDASRRVTVPGPYAGRFFCSDRCIVAAGARHGEMILTGKLRR
jgi:hypothetical protein